MSENGGDDKVYDQHNMTKDEIIELAKARYRGMDHTTPDSLLDLLVAVGDVYMDALTRQGQTKRVACEMVIRTFARELEYLANGTSDRVQGIKP